MHDPLTLFAATVFLIVCLGALVLGVIWTAFLVKVLIVLANRPTARVGVALSAQQMPRERVTVIIPAHNEARVIEHLVRSLKSQDYPDLRFILSLDRCTDATLQLARETIGSDDRFVILEIAECPPDWAGKVHAVQRAVEYERSQTPRCDLLLFADADTRFAPEAIRATVAVLRDRKLEMLTLMTTLSCDLWFERIAQTAATMEVGRMFPASRTNATTNRRGFANGQFMLFDRAAYESFDGHRAVKEAILEDLALARLMAREERPTQVLLADGLVRVHMYDSFKAFRLGWKRIYIECVDWRVKRLARYGWTLLVIGAILPIWALGLLALGLAAFLSHEGPALDGVLAAAGMPLPAMYLALGLGAFSLTAYFVTLMVIYTIAGARKLHAFTHPIGAWLVGGIYLDAARDVKNRVPIRWGGREYTREPR